MMNVEEAASYMDVTPETIRVLARQKRIPAAKVGKLWRFDKDDLNQFIRGQYQHDTRTTTAPGSSPEQVQQRGISDGLVIQLVADSSSSGPND
jgi:excisionase family DNA binding protein